MRKVLKRFSNRAEGASTKTINRLVTSFVREAAKTIAVDTGHAKDNIVVGLGAPDTTESFNRPKFDIVSTGAVVERARRKIKKLKKGQDIHVSFNAPYVVWLENGVTRRRDGIQPGFIKRALDIAIAKAKRSELRESS